MDGGKSSHSHHRMVPFKAVFEQVIMETKFQLVLLLLLLFVGLPSFRMFEVRLSSQLCSTLQK